MVIPSVDTVHTIAFDFDGVFTDNKVWIDQSGRENVRCDRGDGLAFDILRAFRRQGKLSADLFILSRESNAVVQRRARKLNLDCRLCVGDKLGFMKGHLKERFPSLNDPFPGVVYLGNDLNDLPVMRRVGFAVAPEDAHPRVLEVSDLVIARRGGDGFIRAFVEYFLRIDELTEDQIDELISNC